MLSRLMRGAGWLVLVPAVAWAAACSGPPADTPPPTPARPPGCPSFTNLSQGLPLSRGWKTNPSLADVNGDGYLDLAVTSRKGEGPKVFLFDPAGSWTDSSGGISLDLYPCGVGVDLVDLTGDGLTDLLVADHCTGIYLFQGDGRGGWKRLAHIQHPSGEGFDDAAAGDLDGDGRPDLAAFGAFTTGISLYRQERPGAFRRQEAPLPRSGHGFDMRLADLDGDGRLDIFGTLQGLTPASTARGEQAAKIWLQRPLGGAWQAVLDLPTSGDFYGMAVADLNQDGLPDLAMSSLDPGNGVLIYLGTGRGTWAAAPGAAPGQASGRIFAGLAFADFDQDGRFDLVAVEHQNPAIAVWLGDGAGAFAECPDPVGPLPESYQPGWGLAVGDINRDGHPDIAAGFGSEAGGAVRAWASTPHSRP